MKRIIYLPMLFACLEVMSLSSIIYADACRGDLASCISWGPNSPEAEQYNYCCTAALPMIVSCVPPNATARENDVVAACGNLMNREYDVGQQAWFCYTLASQYSCGGNPGVSGGCQAVGCDGG